MRIFRTSVHSFNLSSVNRMMLPALAGSLISVVFCSEPSLSSGASFAEWMIHRLEAENRVVGPSFELSYFHGIKMIWGGGQTNVSHFSCTIIVCHLDYE